MTKKIIPIRKNQPIISKDDLPFIDDLDNETVLIILNSTHDMIQKRLCNEVLNLRSKLNNYSDIPPDTPVRA